MAAWLILAACCGIALFLLSSKFPVPLQVALLIFTALAISRSFEALTIFAGLGPVSGGVLILAGSPYGGGTLMEAMTLAMLGGGALRLAFGTDPIELTDFEWALLAFAALVAASCLSQWPTILLRAGLSEPVAASAGLLFRGYVDRAPWLTPVVQAVQLIEGLGLAALAARVITGIRAPSLAASVVLGSAGAAALNIQRVAEVAIRQPSFPLETLRVSTQYGDINAAGSYFGMMAVLCLALTGAGGSPRGLAIAVLPVIATGLWLSGSRVALLAAVLCGAWVLLHHSRARSRATGRRWTIGVAAALLLLCAVAAAMLVNPTAGRARFGYSVFARIELLKTGLRMVADRPVIGIGISQFYELFPLYASKELRQAFAEAAAVPVTHENAHNNLMQVLAELGTVGLAAFVLVLAAASRRTKATHLPLWRLAAVSGVAAFLLTCLGGHPLLTPMVAFPFWLILGLAASGAAPMVGVLHRKHLRRLVVTGAAVLLATLPLRADRERHNADLSGVSIGFSKWERDNDGNRFRLAGERSTLFAASSSPFVRIPLRSPDARPRRVQLRLDGRQVSEVIIPPGRWHAARLLLPADRTVPKFRRIDIIVDDGVGDSPSLLGAILVGRLSEAPGQE